MHDTRYSLPLDHLTEIQNDEIERWRTKLTGWKPVRRGTNEPCWLCDEIGEYTTYESPDLSRTQDWAYDICSSCAKKIGFDW